MIPRLGPLALALGACLACTAQTGPVVAPMGPYLWRQLANPGSGSMFSEWRPNTWPIGLMPVQAPGNGLWMGNQAHAWTSTDGLAWSRQAKTDWGERIYAAHVLFRGKLWLFGGMQYVDGAFRNDVWSSDDGVTWARHADAPWSPRGGHAVVVYGDRLFLLGGGDQAGPDRGLARFRNDVWVSADGVSWTELTAAAPWAARAYPRAVAFRGALYLLGGDGQADTWWTTDGKAWHALQAEAAWQPRQGYGALAYDNQLWVFGGAAPDAPTQGKHDVWRSPDGVAWERMAEHAPWSPRTATHSLVYQDKVWIYSGKHTGAADNWSSEIWRLERAP